MVEQDFLRVRKSTIRKRRLDQIEEETRRGSNSLAAHNGSSIGRRQANQNDQVEDLDEYSNLPNTRSEVEARANPDIPAPPIGIELPRLSIAVKQINRRTQIQNVAVSQEMEAAEAF